MGLHKIDIWPFGDDAGRVNRGVAIIIMALDMIEVADGSDAGHLVDLEGIIPEIWHLVDMF